MVAHNTLRTCDGKQFLKTKKSDGENSDVNTCVVEIKITLFIFFVLIIDGHPEIGVHLRSKIGNLICIRQLLGSTALANL